MPGTRQSLKNSRQPLCRVLHSAANTRQRFIGKHSLPSAKKNARQIFCKENKKTSTGRHHRPATTTGRSNARQPHGPPPPPGWKGEARGESEDEATEGAAATSWAPSSPSQAQARLMTVRRPPWAPPESPMMGDGGFPRWIRPSPPWMAPAAHLARRWPWLRRHPAPAEQGCHGGLAGQVAGVRAGARGAYLDGVSGGIRCC